MDRVLTSATDGYHLHQRLGYRLSRLSKLMQTRLEAGLAEHGLTRLKWCILSGVGLEGIATPSELADHIGITRPAASRLLMQMRKNDLIGQSLDDVDGRSRQIELTPLGQETLKRCLPLVEDNQRHFTDKLGVQEIEAFGRVLDRLLEGEEASLDRF